MKTNIAILLSVVCLFGAHGQTTTASFRGDDATITHEDGGSPTATVNTYGRRPLEESVIAIGREYGWAVNYEEAPIWSQSQIVDDHPDDQGPDPIFRKRVLLPKGEPFSATFPENRPGQAGIEIVLRQLISQYNASGNPGHYKLEHPAPDVYIVKGDKYKSDSVGDITFTPILDCVISLSIQKSGLHDALVQVAQQVNNTCKEAVIYAGLAALMPSQLRGAMVSGEYKAIPARQVIQSLIAQDAWLQFYTLDYVPGPNLYYLDVWIARRNTIRVGGESTMEPIPRASGDHYE